MAGYKVKQGDIFGRIGSGIGQGFAQQFPEEMQRGRLATGLQQLSQQKDLTPFQQFASLVSQPGITPQMVQTGGELLRQQGIAEGFGNAGQQQNPFSENNQRNQNVSGEKPISLVNPKATNFAIQPYIPKTLEEIQQRAGELYNSNRKLYPTAQDALKGAAQEDVQNQAISTAQQAARQSAQGVEQNIRGEISKLREAANSIVPNNVYDRVENEALDNVKNGMSELDAAKGARDKLDKISREYNDLKGLGGTFSLYATKDPMGSIRSLRQEFKKRNDLENFADFLRAHTGVSTEKSYYLAFDNNDYPEVKEILSKVPVAKDQYAGGYPAMIRSKQINETVNKIAPVLRQSGASPLAISEALRMKGYDPSEFLSQMKKKKDEYDFTERQVRELDKPLSRIPNLSDLWLFLGSGMDNVVED